MCSDEIFCVFLKGVTFWKPVGFGSKGLQANEEIEKHS